MTDAAKPSYENDCSGVGDVNPLFVVVEVDGPTPGADLVDGAWQERRYACRQCGATWCCDVLRYTRSGCRIPSHKPKKEQP